VTKSKLTSLLNLLLLQNKNIVKLYTELVLLQIDRATDVGPNWLFHAEPLFAFFLTFL